METGGGKVLVIEDDREIAGLLAVHLADMGLEPVHAWDGAAGLRLALGGSWELVVLDWMLPTLDGISVCAELRKKDPVTPILMLTAKSDEIDRVLGLELGADDYMTKPFSVREFAARVKALRRRSRASREGAGAEADEARGAGREGEGAPLRIGELELDVPRHRVSLRGVPLELTVKEFELLAIFMKNPGRVFTRAELLRLAWGYDFEGYEHTVNTHINRIRNKLEGDPSRPRFLKTVWGLGYSFAEPAETIPDAGAGGTR